jgi:hypothetical protein
MKHTQKTDIDHMTRNTVSTGNKILPSEGTSVFNVHIYCETKQFGT